jgi:hypothetical protein
MCDWRAATHAFSAWDVIETLLPIFVAEDGEVAEMGAIGSIMDSVLQIAVRQT